VNVVSKKTIRAFLENHDPEALEPLSRWYNLLRKSSPTNFAELRAIFASADFVNPFTVFLLTRQHLAGCSRFNVGGNKYRIITLIDYEGQFTKIRHVFTHPEYDDWNNR
jgi:mRNA interferase HigB